MILVAAVGGFVIVDLGWKAALGAANGAETVIFVK